uniref:Uncharacterized protein n=2 Tax=Anguilla anguilla TaxID=7936 RepID=A0A0E9RXL6_ANGAN
MQRVVGLVWTASVAVNRCTFCIMINGTLLSHRCSESCITPSLT